MKCVIQTRQPIMNPSDGVEYDLIAGNFDIPAEDQDNAVANTAYGVFVIRRADILCCLIVQDELDLSTLQNALILN